MVANLFTKVNLPSDISVANYKHSFFFIGSCFSNSIGNIFTNSKLQTLINPFGVLFNPISVLNAVENIISKKVYSEKDLFLNNEGVWISFDHSSQFSALTSNEALSNINKSVRNAHSFLLNTDYIFITLGTAWVYENNSTGGIVANCHRFPQKKFNKRILSVDEVYKSLAKIVELVKRKKKSVEIVFTLSPVRHIKDGVIENARSKAILLTAIHQLCDTGFAKYFPSFEIMTDELRDYRYYKSDLLHPSDLAVDIIYEKLASVFFDNHTKEYIYEHKKLNNLLNHRPVFSESGAHKKTLLKITQMEEEITRKYFGK